MFDSPNSPFAPLPGTTPAPRGLFVDRWGTLLVTPERGYARTPDEVQFVPGALDALFRAVRAGWRIYLVGNEDAVAYGDVTEQEWRAIDARIQEELAGAGVSVARDYTCTTRPDGVPGQSADSVYLLPNTGSFYHASHEDGIELEKSWVIGDSTLEIVAGWRAGVRQAAMRTGQSLGDRTFEVDPELQLDDLVSVVDVLLERTALSA